MSVGDIEKFRRHIGKGKHYQIGEPGQEEGFHFEPLGTDDLADFVYFSTEFGDILRKAQREQEERIKQLVSEGKSREEAEELTPLPLKFPKELFTITTSLLESMVKQSCPEIAKEKRVLELFVSNNFSVLLQALTELNSGLGSSGLSDKQKAEMERLKARAARV